MKKNMFGEMQPETLDDLIQVLDEHGLDAKECSCSVMDGTLDNEPGTRFYGWCAEFTGEGDDGEGDTEFVEISTCAWPSKDELLADLHAAGFRHIQDVS